MFNLEPDISPVEFKSLVIRLADRVGHHHIPVNNEAQEIADFVGADAVHCELVPKLIRAIYKANKCGYLGAPVSAEATFDALGKIHGELLRSRHTDLDQLRLLQQLGEHTAQYFNTVGVDGKGALEQAGSTSSTVRDGGRADGLPAGRPSDIVTFSRR